MNLCAGLIVRNELQRYLPLVISHLRDFCDTIIVVDDASDDGTAQWLETQVDGQLTLARNQTPDNHNGRTRQKLLDIVLRRRPDVVLALDADEFIADGPALRAKIEQQPDIPVWGIDIAECWNAHPDRLDLRIDGGWRIHPLPMLWKVPDRLTGDWKIRDKKLACQRTPIAVDRIRAGPSGATCLHFGWTDPSERKARYDRYQRLDGGRFHASRHLASIMWPQSRMQFRSVPWPEQAWAEGAKEKLLT